MNLYQAVGRNLLRTRDFEGRFKTLKRGRLQAVSFLSELPLTKHDLQSFAVDLTLFTVRFCVNLLIIKMILIVSFI